jgi:TetR/AcrR family transcriptional regulator, fatty acid metabolism regulator protein
MGRPPGAISEPAKAASRARILVAARTLFAERGFEACRVADIARQAGMSPGNVYWQFDSKEAILAAILAEGFGSVEAMTAEVADAYGPARRKLDLLVERTLALYGSNAEFMAILGGLMGRGGRERLASLGFDMLEIGGRYHANLRRVFAEARSEGAVAPADPELLTAFYFAFFNGLLITYADLWPALPPDAVRGAALRLVGYRPAG